jgi:hypothetical protein
MLILMVNVTMSYPSLLPGPHLTSPLVADLLFFPGCPVFLLRLASHSCACLPAHLTKLFLDDPEVNSPITISALVRYVFGTPPLRFRDTPH